MGARTGRYGVSPFLVTYPGHLAASLPAVEALFDDSGLLPAHRPRRGRPWLRAGGPLPPSRYRPFDGIQVPTRGGRVYVRNPDGSPARESVSIAIDVWDLSAFG